MLEPTMNSATASAPPVPFPRFNAATSMVTSCKFKVRISAKLNSASAFTLPLPSLTPCATTAMSPPTVTTPEFVPLLPK